MAMPFHATLFLMWYLECPFEQNGETLSVAKSDKSFQIEQIYLNDLC